MSYLSGYERSAHLYGLFDNKENIDFFKSYVEGWIGEVKGSSKMI